VTHTTHTSTWGQRRNGILLKKPEAAATTTVWAARVFKHDQSSNTISLSAYLRTASFQGSFWYTEPLGNTKKTFSWTGKNKGKSSDARIKQNMNVHLKILICVSYPNLNVHIQWPNNSISRNLFYGNKGLVQGETGICVYCKVLSNGKNQKHPECLSEGGWWNYVASI
jgi:hypothetical protein